MRGEYTRRQFVSSLAALVALPAVLSGCRRRTAGDAQPTPKPVVPEGVSLDEVQDAALIRPPLPKSEPIIRVRVMRVRAPQRPLRIGAPNQWLRLARIGSGSRGIALQGPVMVTMEADGWSIVDAHGFRAAIGEDEARAPLEIAPMDIAASSLLEVREIAPESSVANVPPPVRQYPGLLRLFSREDEGAGSFDLVNDVALETYLPGVLAGELYQTWHVQTFAAQAVAARSFAATEIAVFAGKRHYDVTNTASSQMYLGHVGGRDSRAHEGVKMTRGLVLGYGGLLVSGYYSSCCGGVAASAIDAIGSNAVNDVEPLRGRPEPDVCTGAPVYQWKIEQPIELLSRRLIAFGNEKKIKELMIFTRVESIEVIAKNEFGRPTRVRVMDDRQTAAEMTAENFRRAANYSGQGLNPPDKPLRSSNLRATVKRDTVVFEGYGFGHGVGLCQYGAETLAKSGKDHTDILRWYYPGVELVQAY